MTSSNGFPFLRPHKVPAPRPREAGRWGRACGAAVLLLAATVHAQTVESAETTLPGLAAGDDTKFPAAASSPADAPLVSLSTGLTEPAATPTTERFRTKAARHGGQAATMLKHWALALTPKRANATFRQMGKTLHKALFVAPGAFTTSVFCLGTVGYVAEHLFPRAQSSLLGPTEIGVMIAAGLYSATDSYARLQRGSSAASVATPIVLNLISSSLAIGTVLLHQYLFGDQTLSAEATVHASDWAHYGKAIGEYLMTVATYGLGGFDFPALVTERYVDLEVAKYLRSKIQSHRTNATRQAKKLASALQLNRSEKGLPIVLDRLAQGYGWLVTRLKPVDVKIADLSKMLALEYLNPPPTCRGRPT